MKQRVLFLCTGNSCRSQMAEGILRSLHGDSYEVYSAGTDPCGVNPWAVACMREVDVDISGQKSKSIGDIPVKSFDCVVTVCDNAKQRCPVFPGAKQKIHWSIPDPGGIGGTQRQIESTFRNVREMLSEKIESQFGKGQSGA